MANPNILSASSVVGFSGVTVVNPAGVTAYFGAVASGKVRRITNLTVCNWESSACFITISIGASGHTQGSGTTILHQKSVAAGGTFDVLNGDETIHLQESNIIQASAEAGNKLNLLITYEEIT